MSQNLKFCALVNAVIAKYPNQVSCVSGLSLSALSLSVSLSLFSLASLLSSLLSPLSSLLSPRMSQNLKFCAWSTP
jgi:hypothetical protein